MNRPLLIAACARHGIPRTVLTGLTWSEDDNLTPRDGEGPVIETVEQLRRRAGLARRWQPLVIASGPLTVRERAVDDLVRRGYTTAAIAAELGVSPRTVTSVRARLRSLAAGAAQQDDSRVCVVGRPSLLRDLVHDCLVDAGVGAAPTPGYRPNAAVAVAVQPVARDLEVRPGMRLVVCGEPPASLGLLGAVRRGMLALLAPHPSPEELTAAVRRAVSGSATLAESAVQRLVEELYGDRSSELALSSRDRDMLRAIRAGESMKQTARRLGISPKTVENLRRQLFQKVGARSAAEALTLAGWSEVTH